MTGSAEKPATEKGENSANFRCDLIQVPAFTSDSFSSSLVLVSSSFPMCNKIVLAVPVFTTIYHAIHKESEHVGPQFFRKKASKFRPWISLGHNANS